MKVLIYTDKDKEPDRIEYNNSNTDDDRKKFALSVINDFKNDKYYTFNNRTFVLIYLKTDVIKISIQ